LVGLIKSQVVTTEEELFEVKEHIMAALGGTFTPRKKPHFSSESAYEYVEADLRPTIKEAPSSPAAMQEHILDYWSIMFKQFRKVLIEEIIPAMTDLWDLYMVATEGPGKALKPGLGKPPGEYLWSKIDAKPDPT
jgi:hypothetical protein